MKPKDFFAKYAPMAMDTQMKFGVPASVTLAQAALESGWGESGLTIKANNFFGIKDQANDEWLGASINMKTGEVFNGQNVTINSNFRKYDSALDSFNDHAKFLLKNKRYASLFKIDLNAPDYYVQWSNGLQKAGYATALNYGSTLSNMIEIYKLTDYDKQAILKKKVLIFSGVTLILLVIIGTLYLLLRKNK